MLKRARHFQVRRRWHLTPLASPAGCEMRIIHVVVSQKRTGDVASDGLRFRAAYQACGVRQPVTRRCSARESCWTGTVSEMPSFEQRNTALLPANAVAKSEALVVLDTRTGCSVLC